MESFSMFLSEEIQSVVRKIILTKTLFFSINGK